MTAPVGVMKFGRLRFSGLGLCWGNRLGLVIAG